VLHGTAGGWQGWFDRLSPWVRHPVYSGWLAVLLGNALVLPHATTDVATVVTSSDLGRLGMTVRTAKDSLAAIFPPAAS
jgi:hypothetical protein